jgi:prepilin-type N-terminal cleavage/methylation domain-containing protein
MNDEDKGFTLIELLIAITIMGLIMGVVAIGFVLSWKVSNDSTARLASSDDGGFTSAEFTKDVQSTSSVDTAARCPGATGDVVASFAWTLPTQSVDYRYALVGGQGQLTRVACGNSQNTTLVATRLASKPTLACQPNCSTPRIVTLSMNESDGATFSLAATRRTS